MLPGIKAFDLTDRVAIVTGGSKGLGKAMASGFASAGARVVLVSRNQAEVDAAASEIATDFGVETVALEADVTDQPQMEELAKSVIDYVFRWLGLTFLTGESEVEDAQESEADTVGLSAVPTPRGGSRADIPGSGPKTTYVGQEDAPPCMNCGDIMIRAGACYACGTCGETGGCG